MYRGGKEWTRAFVQFVRAPAALPLFVQPDGGATGALADSPGQPGKRITVSTMNCNGTVFRQRTSPAGLRGRATATTDPQLVVDINGYFAPPGSGG